MKSFRWMAVLAAAWIGATGVKSAAAAENVMKTAPASTVAATPAVPHFVPPERLDFAQLIPAPAAMDSVAGRADLETVLQAQAWRTPEQVAWAKLVERDSVFNHAAIIGVWFTAERLPVTAALFKDLGDDLRALDAAAKKPFLRPRPYTVDARVQPCVSVGTSTSYPSGSAMQSFTWAEVLADLFPAQRLQLIERAHRAAWGRLLGGVHFPTDLAAGQVVGEAFAAALRRNAEFRARFEQCRVEIAAVAKAPAK